MSDILTTTQELEQNWPYPGARWWKFDFHTHTPASSDYGKGPNHQVLRQITPQDWLLNFMRAGIECVAVTDHNTGEWIDILKQALSELTEEQPKDFRRLYLFPGVEITANDNIHILAILDTDKTTADVNALLGSVNSRSERGSSDKAADASAIEVIQAISQKGYLPIPAHVDNERTGIWRMSGNTLSPILDLDHLIAIELVDPDKEKPELYRQKGLTVAEVLGSDSHHIDMQTGKSYPGSHYTWVKMSGPPSLEGLRLALLDGKRFSIRRSDDRAIFDPFQRPKHFIEGIKISEARYMGQGKPAEIKFSPWLNALVGGRGTGKSTVVHSLRLVSCRENELKYLAEQSEPSLTFKRFNRAPNNSKEEGGLRDSTKLFWYVARDGVKYRILWSSLGTDITVEEERSGKWVESDIQTVTSERFPIRIFSQGQIAELAGDNPEALLHVIDEAAGTSVHLKRLEETRREFEELHARMRNLDERIHRRDDIVVSLQDTERKLSRFEEAKHAEILKNYQNRARQKRELDRQFDNVKGIVERITVLADALNLDDVPDSLFKTDSKEDVDALSLIDQLVKAVQVTIRHLEEAAQSLKERVEILNEKMAKGDWNAVAQQSVTDHSKLIEELKKEGVTDLSEYGNLVQDRQRLDSEIKELDSLEDAQLELADQSQSRLKTIQTLRKKVTHTRERFLEEVLDQNRFVAIEIKSYGYDHNTIETSLREALNVTDDRFSSDIFNRDENTGIVVELLAGLPDDLVQRSDVFEDRISHLKDRIEGACRGYGDFGGHFNNYLARSFDRQPAFLDNILTWFPEDGLVVNYSPQGDGKNFKPIVQASAGQRSAAMLSFLLAYGDEPLVLDQPEDDLDNYLIYDLVVRQIRDSKLQRQIIVVTHNPNVVVNGDAEMLHTFDFINGQCILKKSGSLQGTDIRHEVCQIMEGGREAFERRYQRLGYFSNVR